MSELRCSWATNDALVRYHDEEWGVPLHSDRRLFEFLCLEGAQAGLSWDAILQRRTGYRRAFADFDPERVAAIDEQAAAALLQDPGIIRNRAKIKAFVGNARAFLAVQRAYGSFDAYIWSFVGGAPQQNAWQSKEDVPASTEASRLMSRDLKKRGFSFVGPTICYAFMQATGMVNDHLVSCFRWQELRA